MSVRDALEDLRLAILTDATREQTERETIALVVALIDKHTVECDANHHLDAVAALASLRDSLTNGNWKENGGG